MSSMLDTIMIRGTDSVLEHHSIVHVTHTQYCFPIPHKTASPASMVASAGGTDRDLAAP